MVEDGSRQGPQAETQRQATPSGSGAVGFYGLLRPGDRFARRWRREQQELAKTAGRGTFIPLTFVPGEAFQFDWSEDWAVIAGECTKLQIAQFKLSHSRAFILRAYPLQTHEMLFDAYNHAFATSGGVSACGIYDNMKTAVDRVRRRKQRDINIRSTAMVVIATLEKLWCQVASNWFLTFNVAVRYSNFSP